MFEKLMSNCLDNSGVAELEGLKAELLTARQEVEQQKAATAKAEKDLATEKVAREKVQARVLEVEETLKGVYLERDSLEKKEKETSKQL